MAEKLIVETPAKLNLVLNIIGRRDDGYHLLETAFQFIDLVDRIEFSSREDTQIVRRSEHASIPVQLDLTLKAAQRLQALTGTDRGVEIEIDKRIPLGGGLGGGSSDAAACLLALNRLWRLDLSLDDLAAIGLELGADVPVFVRGQAAWATGIGEQLEPLELEEKPCLLILPDVRVSTAEVFAAEELTRNTDPLTIRAFLRGAGTNVCEPVVRNRYPQVAEALDWLGQFAAARMSGSGASVFATFDSLTQAEEVKSRLPEKWVAQIVKTMNRNPVHRQLGLSV